TVRGSPRHRSARFPSRPERSWRGWACQSWPCAAGGAGGASEIKWAKMRIFIVFPSYGGGRRSASFSPLPLSWVPASVGSSLHVWLAVSIESVVDDELLRQNGVVILQSHVAEALGDGLQTSRLGAAVEILGHVRAVDDLRQQVDGRILDAVPGDDGLE